MRPGAWNAPGNPQRDFARVTALHDLDIWQSAVAQAALDFAAARDFEGHAFAMEWYRDLFAERRSRDHDLVSHDYMQVHMACVSYTSRNSGYGGRV